MKRMCAMFLLAMAISTSAQAGPYSDDLARCLVQSTTSKDRVDLVEWLFAAASFHPAVSGFATVTQDQLDSSNKAMAELIVNLLTESCREETSLAVQYEGEQTIAASFEILGQVAGQELFSNPSVAEAMSGMEQYVDAEKLQSVLDPN